MIRKLLTRNLKLYFRDRAAVFFSLLSVGLILILFALFLGRFQIDSIVETVGSAVEQDKIAYLVHSWILAGLLSVTTVTSVLGGYGTMVEDKEKRIMMAFKSSPLKPWVYPLINIISAFVIGVIISTLTLLLYFGAIFAICGFLLSFTQLLMAFGMIVFSSFINSVILGFICSFLKSSRAFSSVSILIGTVIGFVNGLYVPIGSLNRTMENILLLFPPLHAAAIFRQILTSQSLTEVFKGAPLQMITDYSAKYGILLRLNDRTVSNIFSIVYMILFAVVALLIMVVNLKRKTEEI